MIDPEARLHVMEIKVRLLPVQAARLRALASARDAPPAVVARECLLAGLALAEASQPSVPDRRAA